MELSRLGVQAGPSSGGPTCHLKQMKEPGELDAFRHADSGEITRVFPCPNRPMTSLGEYFKFVDASHFPAITNEDVLLNKP
jgi:hypothetical protein